METHCSCGVVCLSKSLYYLHQKIPNTGLARVNEIIKMRSAYRDVMTVELTDVYITSQTLRSLRGQDNIHGFLGLLRSTTQHTPLDDLLRVDYNFPTWVVYLWAAQYPILENRDLRIRHYKAFLSERHVESSFLGPD